MLFYLKYLYETDQPFWVSWSHESGNVNQTVTVSLELCKSSAFSKNIFLKAATPLKISDFQTKLNCTSVI